MEPVSGVDFEDAALNLRPFQRRSQASVCAHLSLFKHSAKLPSSAFVASNLLVMLHNWLQVFDLDLSHWRGWPDPRELKWTISEGSPQ